MADHFSFSKLKKFGKGFLKSKLGKMALSAIPGTAAVKGVLAVLKGDLKGPCEISVVAPSGNCCGHARV